VDVTKAFHGRSATKAKTRPSNHNDIIHNNKSKLISAIFLLDAHSKVKDRLSIVVSSSPNDCAIDVLGYDTGFYM
jgi:hypothetical protein